MSSRNLEAGNEIAGYRIESVIGRGGMGVVYLAEHLRLKRKVALKVLAPELAADERFRERFLVEAELAASLDHTNVVTVFDAGEADGLLYIAMRLVEGNDLRTVIEREGALDPTRATSIIAQVASALDAAHAKGLIHRDVKPANVLLTRDTDGHEHAYLTDFGLTKRPDQTTGITKTGQFMGSVDYAAPEQFEGKPLDARTDVYSLGCLAFECLTGRVPFPRDQEAAVMYAHLRNPPPVVTDVISGVPAEVDRVVTTGMAKRPDDRYRSAGALATALASALTREDTGGAGPPARARRRRIVGAAAIVCGGILVGSWMVLHHHTTAGPPTRPHDGSTLPSTGLLLRIDLSGDVVTTSVHPRIRPRSIGVGGGLVWLGGNSVIEKIRADSGAVVADITGVAGACTAGPSCLVTAVVPVDGHLWAAAPITTVTAGGQIVQVDAATNSIVRRVDVSTATSMIYSNGSLWVTSPAGGEVTRVDPTTGRIIATIAAESSSRPTTIAGGEGAVWVVDGAGGIVTRIDAATNKVTAQIPTENASSVAVGGGGVWVTSTKTGNLTEYDLGASRLIRTLHTGRTADSVVVANGFVWVSSIRDGTVVRVDPASGKILQTIHAGPAPYVLAAGDGQLWVLETPSFAPG